MLSPVQVLQAVTCYMLPVQVLQVIRDQANICRSIHLPAQSGSSRVLEAMRRGYTSDTYLALVEHIHNILPGECVNTGGTGLHTK